MQYVSCELILKHAHKTHTFDYNSSRKSFQFCNGCHNITQKSLLPILLQVTCLKNNKVEYKNVI